MSVIAVQPALLNLVPAGYHRERRDEELFDKQHRNFRRAIVMQTIYPSPKPESR
jgi:hypothetical protein